MEELQAELLEELEIELGVTLESDIAILNVKLKNAIREVISARDYLDKHTDEFILADIKKNYIGNIKDLTMYDYAIVGGEGETNHTENGTSRVFKKRESCFNGICRFAR